MSFLDKFSQVFGLSETAHEKTPSEPIVIFTSPEDEQQYLIDHPCACAGQWDLRVRTVYRTDETIEYFHRDVQCRVCGITARFEFAAQIGAYEEKLSEIDEQEIRYHHYFFAHRLLPRYFFENPEGFVGLMWLPVGIRRIKALWEDLGNRLVEDGGIILSSQGIKVDPVELCSRRGAIITLPPPKLLAEAYFVAVLTEAPGEDEARYFVLELTDPAIWGDVSATKEWAVLCEWIEDGARRNHNRRMEPNVARFIRDVEEQLNEETIRRRAGARAVAAQTWDIVDNRDPMSARFSSGAFRYQLCHFAFHALPAAIFNYNPQWLTAVANGRGNEVLIKLWEQAGKLSLQHGERGDIPRDGLSIEMVDILDQPHALVTLPTPLSPPEPYFIGIALTEKPNRIVLLEMAENRRGRSLVTSISSDRMHGIIGEVDGHEKETFFGVLETLLTVGRLSLKVETNTLQHMIHYAELWKETKDLPPGFGQLE